MLDAKDEKGITIRTKPFLREATFLSPLSRQSRVTSDCRRVGMKGTGGTPRLASLQNSSRYIHISSSHRTSRRMKDMTAIKPNNLNPTEQKFAKPKSSER